MDSCIKKQPQLNNTSSIIRKQRVSAGILFVLYTVGVIVIGWQLYPPIIQLTPLNLLISFLILLWNDENHKKELLWFVIGSFLIGFGIEVLGVNTGFPFGSYKYGLVLGPKIWGTPIMIGVNWVLLSYCAGMTFQSLLPKSNILIKSLLGAASLLFLDFIMEPVAIHYDFWTWLQGEIPFQNYLAWFIIAFVIQLIFYSFIRKNVNNVAILLFSLQFLFFSILNLKL